MSELTSQANYSARTVGGQSYASAFWQQFAAGSVALSWKFAVRDAAVQLFGSQHDVAEAYFQDHPQLEKAVIDGLARATVARLRSSLAPSLVPAPEIDPRRDMAARLIASGSTRKAAAETVGMPYSSFYRLVKDSAFVALVETYKAEAAT